MVLSWKVLESLEVMLSRKKWVGLEGPWALYPAPPPVPSLILGVPRCKQTSLYACHQSQEPLPTLYLKYSVYYIIIMYIIYIYRVYIICILYYYYILYIQSIYNIYTILLYIIYIMYTLHYTLSPWDKITQVCGLSHKKSNLLIFPISSSEN